MCIVIDDRRVGRLCVSALTLALVLATACGKTKSQPPPPTPVPSTASDASPAPVAQVPDAETAAAPTCVPADAAVANAHTMEGALVACYHSEGAGTDSCWRVDLSTRVWTFASQQPHVDSTPSPARVTATSTAAKVCKPDGSDCKTVPLSDIGDDEEGIVATTNADRSIVAVFSLEPGGPPALVHVFDATGKRLATIKPWKTAYDDEGAAFFRAAHVLGDVIEVRITDSPMSSAIRLYDARNGKKIADVFGGKSMDDNVEPFQLGPTRYAFVTMGEKRNVLDVDVTSGKQLASYPLPGEVSDTVPLLAGAGDGLVGVVGTTVFVGSRGGKVSEVRPPVCK